MSPQEHLSGKFCLSAQPAARAVRPTPCSAMLLTTASQMMIWDSRLRTAFTLMTACRACVHQVKPNCWWIGSGIFWDLCLSWNWVTDSLSYKHRPVTYEVPTLRNIYRVLATQYDPLGYMLPLSTRAKLIIRQLWDKKRGWDDSNLPAELLQVWSSWEAELES